MAAERGTAPPDGPDWYGPPEWEVESTPAYWRRRRPGRFEGEDSAEHLEARLADLRDKVRLMEAEIAELRGKEHSTSEGR